MGFSNPENKPWAAEKIAEINPRTVLDVGAGQGTYLDIVKSVSPDVVKVHAIEVWEPYIEQFNLRQRYDRVFRMDVREVVDFYYDLVIFGDVLEHMTEAEAIDVWRRVSSQARWAIIAIPIVHYHQDAINDNPYEVHVEEDWSEERVLDCFSNIVEYKIFEVTGTFIARFNN